MKQAGEEDETAAVERRWRWLEAEQLGRLLPGTRRRGGLKVEEKFSGSLPECAPGSPSVSPASSGVRKCRGKGNVGRGEEADI